MKQKVLWSIYMGLKRVHLTLVAGVFALELSNEDVSVPPVTFESDNVYPMGGVLHWARRCDVGCIHKAMEVPASIFRGAGYELA